jgi:hypothetical protein
LPGDILGQYISGRHYDRYHHHDKSCHIHCLVLIDFGGKITFGISLRHPRATYQVLTENLFSLNG